MQEARFRCQQLQAASSRELIYGFLDPAIENLARGVLY
jgi:hypothetical protein